VSGNHVRCYFGEREGGGQLGGERGWGALRFMTHEVMEEIGVTLCLQTGQQRSPYCKLLRKCVRGGVLGDVLGYNVGGCQKVGGWRAIA